MELIFAIQISNYMIAIFLAIVGAKCHRRVDGQETTFPRSQYQEATAISQYINGFLTNVKMSGGFLSFLFWLRGQKESKKPL